MADYGLRISKTGTDVKTGDDDDMVLTSKYSLFKGILSGSGSATVNSGATTTININHNLGYIPMGQVFIKLPSDVVLLPTDVYLELPQPFVATGVEVDDYSFKSTTSTMSILLYWEDLTESLSHIHIPYQYFIFLDKGKL